MEKLDLISSPQLKLLVEAGALNLVRARGTRGGFLLCAQVGMRERTLAFKRGGPRVFATLIGVHSYAHKAGLRRFEVDLAGYTSQ